MNDQDGATVQRERCDVHAAAGGPPSSGRTARAGKSRVEHLLDAIRRAAVAGTWW